MNVALSFSNDHAASPTSNPRTTPHLRDVSETMLWALYNRAAEAGRPDGVLTDPDSVKIYEAIDYDFQRHFGDPAGSLAVRGAAIDLVLRRWLKRHPDGLIVSLGEGLETQARRVDNGTMRWLSVDLPEAIQFREQFLKPTDRFRHIAVSALDTAWMDGLDTSRGVFIVAQGLLMYLQPEAVRQLLSAIADRFTGAEMVFDVVPRWFSRLTMIGLQQTAHYRLPPMPWGLDRDEAAAILRRWHPRFTDVAFLAYRMPRGPLHLWEPMSRLFPMLRTERPSLIHLTIGTAPCLSTTRINDMISNQAGAPNPGTMSDMVALAKQTAGSGSDLAVAAGQVIAKRVALGVAAAVNPIAADHAEFARMVPEKVGAFSAAGVVMVARSEEARSHITRFATHEVMTAARATFEMATYLNPLSVMEAQGRFARAWFDRASSNFMALGMMALKAQADALSPLQNAVAANTERLT
ncbi:MAG TPA: hypothetical protein DDZ81_00295 [Acetobacteraceae bacterium]|jgi:O-methyltransferase involved in polyketide biosynthesis|nr:hypothetical protein [Acetobacteraceae bacterium]